MTWPEGIGILGAGSMGSALLAGITRSAPEVGASFVVSDVVASSADALARTVGGVVGSAAEAGSCDLVIIAVKPPDVPAALERVSAAADRERVVLSVAAGVTLDRLAAGCTGVGLVRTMPNLAVRHGVGVVGVARRDVSDAAWSAIAGLLEPLGAVVDVPEALFPAITALAGSGPGFVALVAEGLEDGAVACGIARDQARAIVRAVLAGTAALLDEGTDPATLRQRVSSPGGTTIVGLAVLERGAVRAHLADAVRAASARASEL